MDNTTFERLANATLSAIHEACLDQLPDADTELQGGILTITLPTGQYVVNRHGPTQQVWLSSPVSGASHYAYQDGTWVSTRGGKRLEAVLTEELGILLS